MCNLISSCLALASTYRRGTSVSRSIGIAEASDIRPDASEAHGAFRSDGIGRESGSYRARPVMHEAPDNGCHKHDLMLLGRQQECTMQVDHRAVIRDKAIRHPRLAIHFLLIVFLRRHVIPDENSR